MDDKLKNTIKQAIIKEMFNISLEPMYKKLDKVSNDVGKHKLVYQWVKSGHIDFKTYLQLVKYIEQDVQI